MMSCTSSPWFACFARRRFWGFSSVALVTSSFMVLPALAQDAPTPVADGVATHGQFLDQYCTECHNDDDVAGQLSMVGFNPDDDVSAGNNLGTWEKILRKAGGGEMPPPNREQPPAQAKLAFTQWLEGDEVDINRFPQIAQHHLRMLEDPVVKKVLARQLA